MSDTIVVGYDDSDAARAALRWAIDHARHREAEVLLTYVVSSVAEWELAAVQVNPDPIRRSIEQRLRLEWSAPVREAGLRWRPVVRVGRPAEELMRCAREEHASLIVVGMSTRGTLAELVMGSLTHDLLRHAARPVVAVPASWVPTAS